MLWRWIVKAFKWLIANPDEAVEVGKKIIDAGEQLLDLSGLDWRPSPKAKTHCPICGEEIPIEQAERDGKAYYRWKCDICGASRNWN